MVKRRRSAAKPIAVPEEESDESESSDAEEVIQLPASKKKKAPKHGHVAGRGVVYLGRIPYGFFEDQMRGFFSQFGEVTRLRLSRNKKTGNSKHYAFIEFEHEEVADIVAEAMDGYLLFNHILKCERVPPEKVHPELFKGANKKYKPKPTRIDYKIQHNKTKTPQQQEKRMTRMERKQQAKQRRLKELGIDYDFTPLGCRDAVNAALMLVDLKTLRQMDRKKRSTEKDETATAVSVAAKVSSATPRKKSKGISTAATTPQSKRSSSSSSTPKRKKTPKATPKRK